MTKIPDLEIGDTVRYRCFDAHCGCSLDPDDGKTTHESELVEAVNVAFDIWDYELDSGWSPDKEDFEKGICEVV